MYYICSNKSKSYRRTMSKLKLIQGKFYIDSKEVPLQFGNADQIKLIKKSLQIAEEGAPIDFGVNESTTYTISAYYTCPVCNRASRKESDMFEDYEPDDKEIEEFLEEIDHCWKCHSQFELIKKDNTYKLKLKDNEQ